MYSIIDIETTGGNPYRDKITEIAIFVHDGEKVIREYNTLINPERHIPPFITRMTGISDEMVIKAPKFYEVAKDIVKITEGTVFVAHNASFDYNFVKSEFKNLGYYYQRECLCTVKLSRKLIPGKRSYSLGRLCRELDIQIEGRHRAGGDALATVKLFELLLTQKTNGLFLETLGTGFNNTPVNQAITRQVIEALPSKTGVYYFFDEKDNIIYIGKSKNIRQRVLTHLSRVTSKKALGMVGMITKINYEVTGSELLALLKESEDIKSHQPVFNRLQRRCLYNYGLYSYTDEKGYLCLKIDKNSNGTLPHTSFANLEKGKSFLFRLTDKFNLCQNLTGLYSTNGACFQYAVKQCRGACVEKESPEEYNKRAQEAIDHAGFVKQNLIVTEPGRSPSESAFIIIENGTYMGYGYVEKTESIVSVDDFKNFLIPAEDNRDARQIINGFLRNKRTGKRINF
ncbi:MAG: exonuclease domain-containing protein [Bacteroidales bacterium]